MTHAALVIQNGYRSYCENKRFKKSQNQSSSTVTTQDSQFTNYYKHYQHEQHQPNSGTTSKEPSPSGPLKYESQKNNFIYRMNKTFFFRLSGEPTRNELRIRQREKFSNS